MEAREKLFHLDGGRTLLDFGCGAAELLTYYAPEYEQLVGVDFSESMLKEANKRIEKNNYKNIDLILADHDGLFAIDCLNVEAWNNRITCRTNSGLRVWNSNHVRRRAYL